jgi:arginine utilization protein RocB
MWSIITSFFSNTKNILMAVGAAIVGGYVLTQKYKAYKAEDKLKTVENKIAKANVKIAKETAKAKAKAKDLEHSTEVEVLRELKEERKKVLNEMDEIEKEIEVSMAQKKEVKGRKRGKQITIEV